MSRLKMNWRKYRNLMMSDTGLGWDNENDVPLADDNWWHLYLQARPEDSNLRHKPCIGYIKLCTVFARNTATGSRARSSAQIPPPFPHGGAPPEDEPIHVADEPEGDMGGFNEVPGVGVNEGCSSRARKGKRPVLDRLINSFETASKSITSKLNDRKMEEQCNAMVNAVRAIPGLSPEVMMKALRYLERPERRFIFLSLSPEEQRDYVLNL